MRWSFVNYRTEECSKPALVGELLRTRAPIIFYDEGRGVVLQYIDSEELKNCTPIVEGTKRDPVARFRALAKRVGCSDSARDALNPKPDWDA